MARDDSGAMPARIEITSTSVAGRVMGLTLPVMTQSTRPLTDLEIARSIQLQPIQSIGEQLGVLPDELDPYGKYIAKIDAPAILKRLKDRPNGRYIDVTGIT